MIKNMGIFSRNFFKTLGILGTAIIIIHAIVYFTFPIFYAENQRNKINESADILIKYLEEKNSDEIPLLLESYSKNLRISVHLKEETPKDDSQIVKDLNINKNNESTYIIIEERTLKTKDNKNLSVQFISGTNLIDEAIDIVLVYLPYTLVLTLIFSFIFSYVYSKRLAEPLLYISKVTKKMQNMELDARFDEGNKGELGEVGSQINKVYSKLLTTINDLEIKNKNIIELQEQKVAFLRAASHELKTPLTGIRIILENMKYNVGVYKFQEWTENKQILNIKNAVEIMIDRYREMYLVKNIKINNSVKDTTTILMSKQALDKVLSNVVSNAIKYSSEDSSIQIYDDEEYLYIDNPCKPLSEEAQKNLFKIFYHTQVINKPQNGTGLGLYIVKNILESYDLEYSLKPYEHGMRFKIRIDNKEKDNI